MKKVAREVAGGEGKKAAKVDLKKLFRLGLVGIMAFISAIGVWPEEQINWVVSEDTIVRGGKSTRQYFLDKDIDGFGTRILELQNRPSSDMLKRYLQVGGQLVYEDDGLTQQKFYNPRIIAIITKDGDQFEITDLFPDAKETYTYAFAKKASEAQAERR